MGCMITQNKDKRCTTETMPLTLLDISFLPSDTPEHVAEICL